MSKSPSLQGILTLAKEKEKKYDWVEAAELYEQALRLVGKRDFLKKGEIQQKVGYASYRAGMQAESVIQFRERMHRAVASYEKATEFYEMLNEPGKTPRMLRCEAIIAYLKYWVASEVSEKKRLLSKCWRLTKETLKAFEEAGEALEYGKTYNELSSSAFFGYVLEWDFQAGEKIIREAMECGEQAINLLSSVCDSHELARAYVKAAFYVTAFGIHFISDMDEKERHHKKGQGYWQKAYELSEEAALLELSNTPSSSGDEFGWNIDELIVYFEKALGRAKKTKDKYMIGTALDWLTYATKWKTVGIDDPDKRAEILQRAFQYAEDAKQHFSSISFVSPRSDAAWTGAPQLWYYRTLGMWETSPRKKRDLLEKAVMYGTQALKQAESTGYPRIITFPHHELSVSLALLARVEANLEAKRRLLEKALEHRKEVVRIIEQCYPFEYYNLGLQRLSLAGLKAELLRIEKDSENRKNMLEEAISDTEHSLRLMIKEILYAEKRGELAFFAALGSRQYFYGELLIHLYGLTSNNEDQRKAIKAFEEAVESYQKLNLFSRMAECYWKAAESYDALGEHTKAAENFNLASTNYVSAAEKIPQLKDFYQDHARYMQAWSEIEKARHHHRRQGYGKAKEHYEKSAGLHKSTKRWSYLSLNYLAWARLEEAEDLSRKEQTEEAKDLFQQAAKQFAEAKKSIKAKLEKIEITDEKEMSAELVKASDVRREYCLGRIALEEAKILDRQGDHTASSKKYGLTAEMFQKMMKAGSEQSRRELQPIIYLCQAWQKMMMAEAKASSTMFGEAAELFKQAKEHTLDQPSSLLALANSSFCKALEAGTEFEITTDMTMYSTAKKRMEAAEKYYLKAGFKNASEYARATHMLFDAYMYMNRAETETGPAKKAQYYRMAEKVLQASAGSYMKAKHPEKSEQVQRLLESVKEKRQLAMSLTEVLHVPTVASATTSFSTPTPTHEQAVGLERFEHADIQANLLLRVKEVKVGEDVDFRMELVNAGKAPALLVKVDEIVPEAFEIKEVPEIYMVEDRYLNMKGRRLNPLKTEDVKLVVEPRSKGTHTIKPRILYIDETGKYKSHEPEPVTITVKELGIKGWIKGER